MFQTRGVAGVSSVWSDTPRLVSFLYEARIQCGKGSAGGGHKCGEGFFGGPEGLNLLSEWGRGRYDALVHVCGELMPEVYTEVCVGSGDRSRVALEGQLPGLGWVVLRGGVLGGGAGVLSRAAVSTGSARVCVRAPYVPASGGCVLGFAAGAIPWVEIGEAVTGLVLVIVHSRGTVPGVPEELLAVFQEAAAKGKAESFLTDVVYLSTVVEYAEMFIRRLKLRVDGELYTDFGIGEMALHFSDIVSGEALEKVFVTFPVTLHGAVHDRLAVVV
ncbi:hypothetical protein DYB30_004690 [Aphanomyces astaci]|uniref:Uncharacterized protein n=1 Tax=Aphanomyces astaci TaxID=112090 RepID=A0A397DM51_APHAT|nr:hypothetical protein DYB34_005905 [Aphanomyces astaci]RHY47429.1 hypothetical protein DYB38_005472 [Aphanomyces astaci]RHY64918.1 hypothetical protein DYB30_004690 [Aphanomyces astaci]